MVRFESNSRFEIFPTAEDLFQFQYGAIERLIDRQKNVKDIIQFQ
jgi:hypothetical protein